MYVCIQMRKHMRICINTEFKILKGTTGFFFIHIHTLQMYVLETRVYTYVNSACCMCVNMVFMVSSRFSVV